jgi:hypothetical protein
MPRKKVTLMKVTDWYRLLPPNIAARARKRFVSQTYDEDELQERTDSLSRAIGFFDWYDTREGDDYWEKLHAEVERMEMGLPYSLDRFIKKY